MGQRGALLVLVLGTVVVVAVALAVRRSLRHRLTARTGWEEWRETARTLPRRDQRAISRANSRGQAAPERLAALAVQRGEALAASLARTTQRRSRIRLLFHVMAGLGLLALALKVLGFALGDRDPWWTWLSTVWWPVLSLAYPPLLRRQARLVERSVDRNRALLD